MYDFQKFKTMRPSGREIYNNDLSKDDELKQQKRLKIDIGFFKNFTKPNDSVRKEKKALIPKKAILLFNGRQKVLNASENAIFSKVKQGKRLASVLD